MGTFRHEYTFVGGDVGDAFKQVFSSTNGWAVSPWIEQTEENKAALDALVTKCAAAKKSTKYAGTVRGIIGAQGYVRRTVVTDTTGKESVQDAYAEGTQRFEASGDNQEGLIIDVTFENKHYIVTLVDKTQGSFITGRGKSIQNKASDMIFEGNQGNVLDPVPSSFQSVAQALTDALTISPV